MHPFRCMCTRARLAWYSETAGVVVGCGLRVWPNKAQVRAGGPLPANQVQSYVSTFMNSRGRAVETCEVEEALSML